MSAPAETDVARLQAEIGRLGALLSASQEEGLRDREERRRAEDALTRELSRSLVVRGLTAEIESLRRVIAGTRERREAEKKVSP